MASTTYKALMLYTRFDNEADNGYLTQLCQRLDAEVRAQTRQRLGVFPLDDAGESELSAQEIAETLQGVIFLIPVLTPSFLNDDTCCQYVSQFLQYERTLGQSDLILPVYYITTPPARNPLAQEITRRQRADWRELRFEELSAPAVRRQVTGIATRIREALERIAPAPATPSGQSDERLTRLQAMLPDHTGFIRDRLANFVGREMELTDIYHRIAQQLPTGGYITISGPSGQGKSSIIAKLIAEYGVGNVVYHFIPLNPGTDYEVSLLRSLMVRLILKYDLSDIYVASENRSALRDFFPRVLYEVAAQGGQEVIFIDGLDQLESDNRDCDLSFLPTRVPAGIVFVLSTYSDDTLEALELRTSHQAYRLPNLSRADFDLLLQQRGILLESYIADRFYTSMRANALCLDLVAKELSTPGSAGPEALAQRIPSDPEHIFALLVGDQGRLRTWHNWEPACLPILSAFLVAAQSLSLQALHQLLPMPFAMLKHTLLKLEGLIVHDATGKYSLCHRKLHDYLRQHLFSSQDIVSSHQRLADWCANGTGGLTAIWQDTKHDAAEQERRTYARQHYITHLYHARNYEQLFAILDAGDYGRAKVRADASARSYAQDLDLGRQAAASKDWSFEEGLSLLPSLWRYSLLRCTLMSCTDNYPDSLFESLVRIGRKQEALGLAELLTEPGRKVTVLCLIGKQLWQQGRPREREAQQVLLRASEVARRIKGTETRAAALRGIARTQAQVNWFPEAIAVAHSIEDIGTRAETVREIATAQMQVGQMAQATALLVEAASLARSIERDWDRAAALREIAIAQAQAGQFTTAIATVQGIDDAETRAGLLREIAIAQARIGQSAEASALLIEATARARKITGPIARAATLREIAIAQAQVGQDVEATALLAETTTTARGIEQGWDRAAALREIAIAQAQVGLFAEATSTVQGIEQGWDRAAALREIAIAQARAGLFAEASATAWGVDNTEVRATALREIVVAQAKAGLFAQATDLAQRIDDAEVQVTALREIAVAQARAGQGAHSTAVLDKALGLALEIGNMETRHTTLREIAIAQAQTRQFVQAHATVQLIESPEVQVAVLQEIVIAQAKTGQFAEAIATAHKMTSAEVRVGMLWDIAALQAQAGQTAETAALLNEAMTLAREIEWDWERTRALQEIVQSQAQSGWFVEATATASTIENHHARDEALRAITAVQMKQEQPAITSSIGVAPVAPGMEHNGAGVPAVQDIVSIMQTDNQQQATTVLADTFMTWGSLGEWVWMQALATIADTQAQAGRFEQAAILARGIGDEGIKAKALQSIGVVRAQIDNGPRTMRLFTEAATVARKIKDMKERAEALGAIARAQSQSGDAPGAALLFAEAASVARAIKDERALATIALAQAQGGDASGAAQLFAEAVARARGIKNELVRVEMLRDIACMQAQSGDGSGAAWLFNATAAAAQAIENEWIRVEALCDIVHTQVQAGQQEQALRLVQDTWLQAATHDYLLQLLSMSMELIKVKAHLGDAFVQSFTWVATFLRGK